MEHYFDLPVTYEEEELSLKGRLVTFGYVYKFYIVVEGQELIFEKDDEQQYRILAQEGAQHGKAIAPGLIQAIIDVLNSLTGE